MRCAICGNEGDTYTLHVHRTDNGVIIHEDIPVCRQCVCTLFTLRGYVEDLHRYLGRD